MFFQHENRFRYKFFRYCSIFKVLCASALAADDLIILPQKRVFVKHFFERFLRFIFDSVESFYLTFILKCFILSDVRLTVMYFSTASFKKQALFYNFYAKIILLTFCPVFYIFYRHFLPYSSKSRVRSRIRILRSRREICTCVVCNAFAVSLWVRLP